MTGMCPPHRRDSLGMVRPCDPVANCGANRSPAIGSLGIGARRPAGDEQQHPVPPRNRVRQPGIQHPMGRRQRVAMQVDRAFGRYQPARQSPVPTSIERGLRCRFGRSGRPDSHDRRGDHLGFRFDQLARWRFSHHRLGQNCGHCRRRNWLGPALDRAHRCHHPRPQRSFLGAKVSAGHCAAVPMYRAAPG